MTTLTATLGTALSGLQTSQASLSTVSHNIANVNTEGFSRQEVITSGVAISGFGSGVEVTAIRRITDNILNSRVTEKVSDVAYNKAFSEYLGTLQVAFGVPGSSSSTEKLINKMFTDFNALANSPESTSLQLNAVQNVEFVIDTLGTIDTQLQANADLADQQIDRELTNINSALERIDELNAQIVSINIGGSGGQNANDLLDERLRLVNFVSERLNVNQGTDEQGRLRLTTESGRRLVDTSYVQLERIPSAPGDPYLDIGARSVKTDGSLSNDVFQINTDTLTTGSIKALVEVRDTEVTRIQAELDELSAGMIREINLLHSQGTGIPPQNSFTSGNGVSLSGVGADITDPNEMGVTAGGLIDISVVDIATGTPIVTTLAAGGGTGSINIGASPVTLASIAAAINANADIGADVTASVVTVTLDGVPSPQLRVQANNASYGIVMANGAGSPGNTLGELGMNNLLTGTDTRSMAVREDIAAEPSLFATARMRASDGGVSFQDNRNIIEMAALSDTSLNFDAAGGLPAKFDSFSGYFTSISGNLAIRISETESRIQFDENILADLEARSVEQSGVNMDEELAKLITFQNAFQASSRVISVIDELYETMVNIIR